MFIFTCVNDNKTILERNGYSIEDIKRQCVYFHYYNNKLFYIGQGTIKRAYDFCKSQRNNNWNNIVKDINNINVVIKHIDISVEESVRLEKEYIDKYKPIANMINGITITNSVWDTKLQNAKIERLDLNNNVIGEYDSVKDAALAVKGSRRKILDCCIGKRAVHIKSKWRFAF